MRACITMTILLSLATASHSAAQGRIAPTTGGQTVTNRATGTFDVKVAPVPPTDADAGFGRLTLDKKWQGDLHGTSTGVMLAAGTAVKGSAGYVALEKFSGTLGGRQGTFMLQHNGSMQGTNMSLMISVIPDSGTEQLAGLSGIMQIIVGADGSHAYVFEYTLR
jgi:hypothetical protein